MAVVDLASLRPGAQDIEFVAGTLVEQGEATAAGLAADLEMPLTTIAAALRRLERDRRAARRGGRWVATQPQARHPRRSWRQGGGQPAS